MRGGQEHLELVRGRPDQAGEGWRRIRRSRRPCSLPGNLERARSEGEERKEEGGEGRPR